ncbi:MAG: dehydrogenase [Planctomycetes bacterium]|nr:dehydrogenase [Planctomycetota bacterium]
MQTFRIALTGDFLDESGKSAYGDIGLSALGGIPYLQYHFLTDQAPVQGDSAYWIRLYSMEVMAAHIAGINGLVVLRPWVKRAVFLSGATDLVVIGRSGAGYDKIDVTACTENDVAVFNAPLALNHSTASTALMFMLALAKRLVQQDRVTREGRWDQQAAVMGSELQGRTLGIIGLGHSGRELVRLVAPFEMIVLAYSPHADPAGAEALGVRLTSLDELLQRADFMSLHVRLTDRTRRIIGAAELGRMKPTAYLINVARGELIDQDALTAALQNRRIAGAALDVFEIEPLPADDPLTRLDNVILAPHWSCSTADIWKATGQAMAAGMLRAARGLVPDDVVNPQVLERPGFLAKLSRFAVNRPEQDAKKP